MKKILLLLVCSLMAVTSFAQIKSVDVKADYRTGIFGPKGDPGVGVGVTFELAENLDLAPRFNWYMPSHGTRFTAEADVHYNFTTVSEEFYLYPLVGVGIFHHNWKDDETHNRNKILCNLGGGIGYPINQSFTAFGEIKYQMVAGESNDTYVTIGLSYCF